MPDSNHDIADRALAAAQASFDQAQGHAKFARGLALCQLLIDKGSLAQALAVLSAIQPLTASDFERAQVLQRQGLIHLRQSQYDKAYYFLGEAMVKLGTHPDSLELYNVYHDLAWMSYRQGYMEKARNYCEGAQLVIKSMQQKSGPAAEQARADLCHLIALIEAASGQFDAALVQLENERQLRLRHDDPVRMASLYNKMGSVLQAMGRMKQALDYQRQTMDQAQRGNDLFRQAVSHKNLGEIYCSIGDLDRALDHYRQSLEQSQTVGNQLGVLFATAGIGRILAAQGGYATAELQLQDALKLARRIKNREQECSVLLDLAELATAAQRPADAARYREAARTLENELDQPLSPRHVISAARQCLAGSDPDGLLSARSLLEELLLAPIVINDEEHISIPELEIEACCLLARALRQLGRADLAAPVLQRAVAAIDAFTRDLEQRDRAAFLARPVVAEAFSLARG